MYGPEICFPSYLTETMTEIPIISWILRCSCKLAGVFFKFIFPTCMYAVTLRTISWISYAPRVLELFGHHSLRTLGTRSVIDSRADGRMVPFAFVQSPRSPRIRFFDNFPTFSEDGLGIRISLPSSGYNSKKTKQKTGGPSSTPQLIPLHVLTGCTV